MCIKVALLSYENPEHSDTPKQARNTFKTTTTRNNLYNNIWQIGANYFCLSLTSF